MYQVAELLTNATSCIKESCGGVGLEAGKHTWIEWKAREVAAQKPHLPDAGVRENFESFISLVGFRSALVYCRIMRSSTPAGGELTRARTWDRTSSGWRLLYSSRSDRASGSMVVTLDWYQPGLVAVSVILG